MVEGDFFGGYPAVGIGDNMGVFRLRLANARLDWAKGSLVAGQDWMIFAPVNPQSLSSAGIPLFAAGGNLWSRLPQVRGEWKTKRVLLQGGILAPQTGDFNSAFFYQPGSGALSETPFVQGRAALTLANFAESKKVATIGVSGHWGQARVLTPVDRTLDSNGVALDFVLPFGSLLTVQGEAFTGTNLGGFQGGVFQGLVMDGAVVGPGGTPVLDGPRALDTAGGWVQVLVALTKTVTVHGGFGTDDPDDADFFTVTRRESRLENTAISVRLPAQGVGPHRVGPRVPPPRHEVPHRRRQGRRPRQRRLHVHVLSIAARAGDRVVLRHYRVLVKRGRRAYSGGMKVAIELPPVQAAQLEAEARRLGVPAEELARAALTDLLAAPDAAFQAAARRILEQNAELYRRLA